MVFPIRKTKLPGSPQTFAFTLVELLVVVAIIVILMAILLPAMEKAMSLAQAAKCGTNLHGLGRAQAMYANDMSRQLAQCNVFAGTRTAYGYNDDVPNAHSWHADNEGETGIRPTAKYPGAVLWKYTNQEGLFQCPTFPGTFAHPGVAGHFNAAGGAGTSPHNELERKTGNSYSMNHGIYSGGHLNLSLTTINGPWLDGSESRLLRAQDTMMISEESLVGTRYSANGRDNSYLSAHRSRNPAALGNSIGDFHPPNGKGDPGEGTANVVFLDGHVDRHVPSESKELAYPGMLWP